MISADIVNMINHIRIWIYVQYFDLDMSYVIKIHFISQNDKFKLYWLLHKKTKKAMLKVFFDIFLDVKLRASSI